MKINIIEKKFLCLLKKISLMTLLVVAISLVSCNNSNQHFCPSDVADTDTSFESALINEYYLPVEYTLYLPDGTVRDTFSANYDDNGFLISCKRVLNLRQSKEIITDTMESSFEFSDNIVLNHGNCNRHTQNLENDTSDNQSYISSNCCIFNNDGLLVKVAWCEDTDSIESLNQKYNEAFDDVPESYLQLSECTKLFKFDSQSNKKNVLLYDSKEDTVRIKRYECASQNDLDNIVAYETIVDIISLDGFSFNYCYPIFNSIEDISSDGVVTTKTYYENGLIGEEIKWIPVTHKAYAFFSRFDWDMGDRCPTIAIIAKG